MSTPTLNAAKAVLYDFPAETGIDGWESFSPFVLEVGRALRLAKIGYERRAVNMMKIKETNPLGQLPVVDLAGQRIADSTRILRRIDELAPGSLTGSLDPSARAEAWLWEEFADTALYPHVLATRWADDRGWAGVRNYFFAAVPAPVRAIVAPMVRRATLKKLEQRDFTRAGLDACYERMRNVLDSLDGRCPDEGFWLGPRATVADLGLFAHLHSLRLPLTPWQAEEIAKRGRLSRYLDRVDAITRS